MARCQSAGAFSPSVIGLRDQVDEINRLERQLVAAKKQRAQLILKLRHAGMSLREIEPLAGMTNARVSQIEQEAKRG